MQLRPLLANGVVLGAIAWMGSFGGMDVEARRLVPKHGGTSNEATSSLAALESAAASLLGAPSTVALASAYLDRDQPGLATAVVERAPASVRARPEVAAVYARALFHRGKARSALAIAREASDNCSEEGACPAWLVARTTRLVSFLEQVVAVGIDDPATDPPAIRAAYERSTHEVRLVALR